MAAPFTTPLPQRARWRHQRRDIRLRGVRNRLRRHPRRGVLQALERQGAHGGGSVKFQQWDGKQWGAITEWIATDQALVRPLVEASAAKYAQEKGLTLRAFL